MVEEFRSGRDVARAEHKFNDLSTKEWGLAFYMVVFEYLVTICPELVNSEIQKNNTYIHGLAPHIKAKVQSHHPNTY